MTGGRPAGGAARGAREWRDVERCDHLLALHLGEAVRRFGAAALGVIDLPPLTGGRVEPAQIRVVATLLWAKGVDDAGLLDFADALAGGVMTGRLLLPLGSGADKLGAYWRGRRERFSSDERKALYARVFGDPHEAGSPAATLEKLVALLVAVDRDQDAGVRATARIGVVAQELSQQISERSAGITAWAARDIIEHVRAALGLLEDREIAGALGGFQSAWTLLRMMSPTVLGHPLDPSPHLERARAGLALLSWLADVAASLDGGGVRVAPDAPVVRAAESWSAAGSA